MRYPLYYNYTYDEQGRRKNMPYAGIAQGNTTNASDCNVFYNGMKARYGSANVLAAGFTVGSDTVDMSNIASVTNFKAAKNVHVLYWSSHGSSYPRLNAGGPKEFESGNTAYVHWCDSTRFFCIITSA